MLRILGVKVDKCNMQQAVERIACWVEKEHGRLHRVVTINPEGIWIARHDEQFARIVEQADLVSADGSGVLWAASKLGSPMQERVTGIDLLEHLCQRAAKQGWRVYLLGAKPGFANEAAQVLCSRYPGLIIAGCENGYFRDREDQVLADIRAASADILFAALGMPFQEKWIYAHAEELGCTVAVGVGGSFDVISGHVRRAPALWQKLRLEWLWRLLSDPKRWRRFLVIPKYMWAVHRQSRHK